MTVCVKKILRSMLVSLIATMSVPVALANSSIIVAFPGSTTVDQIIVEVYADADAFAELRRPLRRVRAGSPDSERRLVIDNLEPGTYAVMAFQDRNGNGVLDRSFIGIPKEPVAFSQAYAPKGPPVFDRASFQLAQGEQVLQVLQFEELLGRVGQIGAGVGMIVQDSPYRGASGRAVQPIPALIYLGERLQIIGPRVSYAVVGSDRVRLAAQASVRIGAYDETDSGMLAGLGDRDTTLMAGAGLVVEAGYGVALGLSYEHDVLGRFSGGTGRLELSRGWQLGAVRLSPQLAINYLDGDLTAYEFGVPAAAVRPDRPSWSPGRAWNPELGLGTFIELTPRWRIVANMAVERLDTPIRGSPIVGSDYRWRGFLALTYTF